jgi:hypothetical protein
LGMNRGKILAAVMMLGLMGAGPATKPELPPLGLKPKAGAPAWVATQLTQYEAYRRRASVSLARMIADHKFDLRSPAAWQFDPSVKWVVIEGRTYRYRSADAKKEMVEVLEEELADVEAQLARLQNPRSVPELDLLVKDEVTKDGAAGRLIIELVQINPDGTAIARYNLWGDKEKSPAYLSGFDLKGKFDGQQFEAAVVRVGAQRVGSNTMVEFSQAKIEDWVEPK